VTARFEALNAEKPVGENRGPLGSIVDGSATLHRTRQTLLGLVLGSIDELLANEGVKGHGNQDND
jgi:hypothetical protein